MCGIVGYIGSQKASPILLSGLMKLEYRGYDSAGIATLEDGTPTVVKNTGRVRNLYQDPQLDALTGTVGIAHTRWATHGEPSDVNRYLPWYTTVLLRIMRICAVSWSWRAAPSKAKQTPR